MSRSGYCEDVGEDGGQPLELYRASVARAIRGKRGQAFLREMAAALDAMPVKELIAGDVVRSDKSVCAIGSVALLRGMSLDGLDVTDQDAMGHAFGVARSLAAEIAFENDDDFGIRHDETPAQRWRRMRAWVARQIGEAAPEQGSEAR